MGNILKTVWKDFMGYEDSQPNIDYKNTFAEIISRSEWGAVPATSTMEFDEMELPIPVAYVRPTGTRECRDRRSCIRVMQEMQQADMDNNMPDIQHNFYIGGDGNVYEGRGWKFMRTPMDQDDLVVSSSISIGVIGPWQVPNKMPPTEYVAAALYLIKLGMEIGTLRNDCLFQSIQIFYLWREGFPSLRSEEKDKSSKTN